MREFCNADLPVGDISETADREVGVTEEIFVIPFW